MAQPSGPGVVTKFLFVVLCALGFGIPAVLSYQLIRARERLVPIPSTPNIVKTQAALEAAPTELGIGIEDTESGAAWMKTSGVHWWGRYRYLTTDATGGWSSNWCVTCASDGRFAKRYLDESGAIGVMPILTFYELLGLPGGGEEATYAKVRNTSAMRTYFSDFQLLMQVAKAFGKPVLVHLEPDGYANIQIQSGGNPEAYAAVADTGLPELAGLPNTVAGWGQAFGALREAAGATNQVLLAPHFSTWATGTDLMRGSGLGADIATHVGRTAAFLGALGTYDLVATEWLDRDAQTRGIWWNPRDDAGTGSLSFVRDLAIFEALNRATGKRLVLWQVPHGTSWSAIKSNHAEYVFGPEGAQHRARMSAVGLVGVLFGAGATGQTTHLNDWGPDGGLYLRGRAAEIQAAPLPPPSVVDAGTPVAVCSCSCDAGVMWR